MSLPTLVKTWLGSYNNQITAQGSQILTNQTLMLAIKNQLLAFGSNPAVVLYSCNSVTAGTAGDGVDRWTTAANLVWNTSTNVKSWMILKQAGASSNYQICIYLEGGNSTGVALTLVTSPSAGFTGGTTTARPTATDEIVNSSVVAWGGVNGNVSVRWSVQQSDDGQCTRILLCTAGAVSSLWGWEKIQNPVSGLSIPVLSYMITTLSLTSLCGVASSQVKFRAGSTNGNIIMQVEADTTALGPADTAYGNAANQLSGEWPMWPIGVASGTSGITGRHGSMFDMWLGSNTRVTGDRYPDASPGPAGQFAQFTNIIIPWNQGPVNLT